MRRCFHILLMLTLAAPLLLVRPAPAQAAPAYQQASCYDVSLTPGSQSTFTLQAGESAYIWTDFGQIGFVAIDGTPVNNPGPFPTGSSGARQIVGPAVFTLQNIGTQTDTFHTSCVSTAPTPTASPTLQGQTSCYEVSLTQGSQSTFTLHAGESVYIWTDFGQIGFVAIDSTPVSNPGPLPSSSSSAQQIVGPAVFTLQNIGTQTDTYHTSCVSTAPTPTLTPTPQGNCTDYHQGYGDFTPRSVYLRMPSFGDLSGKIVTWHGAPGTYWIAVGTGYPHGDRDVFVLSTPNDYAAGGGTGQGYYFDDNQTGGTFYITVCSTAPTPTATATRTPQPTLSPSATTPTASPHPVPAGCLGHDFNQFGGIWNLTLDSGTYTLRASWDAPQPPSASLGDTLFTISWASFQLAETKAQSEQFSDQQTLTTVGQTAPMSIALPTQFAAWYAQYNLHVDVCPPAPTPTLTATATATATATKVATATPAPDGCSRLVAVATGLGFPAYLVSAQITDGYRARWGSYESMAAGPQVQMTQHNTLTGATSTFLHSSASLFFVSYYPDVETTFTSSASFTLLFCTPPLPTASPSPTATPPETPTPSQTVLPSPTGFPGEIGTICPIAPTAPASNVGPAPDLAILVPTLRTLPTITATVQISAEIVTGPIATLQASISTPAAAIQTAVAGYSWSSGQQLADGWQVQLQPALDWLAVLNPNNPAYSVEGGPLWALAPVLIPVLPIVGVTLVVAFIRLFIWFLGWLLKLIDLLLKIIELIPGE